MEVIYELTPKQMHGLYHLFQNEWWTRGRSLNDTIKCVEGSQVCIGLADKNDTLIGFTRILTDYTFKALIFDLIVAKEFRSRGLAKKLISLIKTHDELVNVKLLRHTNNAIMKSNEDK